MRPLPKIKVCGVRESHDLRMLQQAGVDSVGINFVSTSPRAVDAATGRRMVEEARQLGLTVVAVYMDPEPVALAEAVQKNQYDFVQLHGKEHPDLLNACGACGVIKAVSWSGREEEKELATLWASEMRKRPEYVSRFAFLVDAYAPLEGGGTGRRARWDLLLPRPPVLDGFPLILAGGLNAENVANAIRTTSADGVDTASGVETSPGKKSATAVLGFASNAAAALRH